MSPGSREESAAVPEARPKEVVVSFMTSSFLVYVVLFRCSAFICAGLLICFSGFVALSCLFGFVVFCFAWFGFD